MELLKKIITLLEDKKAIDISTLDINIHIKALADNVEVELKKEDIYPNKIEGYHTDWILMDYGDVVVHIFTQQQRQNYKIEELYRKNQ